MKHLVGDIQHSQRPSNISMDNIIANRKMENFDLLSFVAEVHKVTLQTSLEIACHLEGLQPCFCSALLCLEGKRVGKFTSV